MLPRARRTVPRAVLVTVTRVAIVARVTLLLKARRRGAVSSPPPLSSSHGRWRKRALLHAPAALAARGAACFARIPTQVSSIHAPTGLIPCTGGRATAALAVLAAAARSTRTVKRAAVPNRPPPPPPLPPAPPQRPRRPAATRVCRCW